MQGAGANVSIVGGADATLDAGGLSRVLEVSGVLSMRGVRLTSGHANATGADIPNGGALLVHESGAAALDECTLDSSSCDGNGGTVSVDGELEMRNSLLRDSMDPSLPKAPPQYLR